MADETATTPAQPAPGNEPGNVVLPNPPAWLKDYEDIGQKPPEQNTPVTFGDGQTKQVTHALPQPKYIAPLPKPIDKLTPPEQYTHAIATAIGQMYQKYSQPEFLQLSTTLGNMFSDKILSLTGVQPELDEKPTEQQAKDLSARAAAEKKADITDWSQLVGKAPVDGQLVKVDDSFKYYNRDVYKELKKANPTWTGQYLQMQKSADGKILPRAYNMAEVFRKDPSAFGQVLNDVAVFTPKKQPNEKDIQLFNDNITSGTWEDINTMTPQQLDKFFSESQKNFHVNDKLKFILQNKPELSKILMQNPELVDAFKKELQAAPEITSVRDQVELFSRALNNTFEFDKAVTPVAESVLGNIKGIQAIENGFSKMQGELAAKMHVAGTAALRENGQQPLLDEYTALQAQMLSNPKSITPENQKRYAALTLQLNDAIAKSGSTVLGNAWVDYQNNTKQFQQIVKSFPAMLEGLATKEGMQGINTALKQQRGQYIYNNIGKYFPEYEQLQEAQEKLNVSGDKLSAGKSLVKGVTESATTLVKDIAHVWGDDKGVFNLMKNAKDVADDPMYLTPIRPTNTNNKTTNTINDIANFVDEMAHGTGSLAVPMALSAVGGSALELGSFAAQSQYDTYLSMRKAGVDKDTAETAGLVNAMLTAATMKVAFMPSRIVKEQVERLSMQEIIDAAAGKGSLKDAIYNTALKLAPTSGDARNSFLATVQQGAMNIANYVEMKKAGLEPPKQDNEFRNIMQTAGITYFLGALGRMGDKGAAAMMAKRYADENPMMFATAMSNAKVESMATGRYDLSRLNELENSVYKYWQKTYNMPETLTSDQKLAVSHIVDNMNYYRNQMKIAGDNFKPYWDSKMRSMQGELDGVMTDPESAIKYNNGITEPIVEHLRGLIPADERITGNKPFQGIVARHGQTDANMKGLANDANTPLNEAGKKEAKDLGEQMKSQGVTHLITSPSLRTQETAKETGLPYATSESLKEWNTGNTGPVSDFDLKYYVDHPAEVPIGGEPFNDFLGRMQKLRDRTGELDKETGIITHGLTMKLWESLDKSGGKWDDVAKTEFLKDSNDFGNSEMYNPKSGRIKIKGNETAKKPVEGNETVKPAEKAGDTDKPTDEAGETAAAPREATRQEKINDLMDLTDRYNKLAKNATNKAEELNKIRLAAKELNLKVDYGKGFARILSNEGNKMQRRSTFTNKSHADYDAASYSDRTKETVNKLIEDEGMMLGLDIEGADGKNMSAQQRKRALLDIKEGKKTVGAKSLYDAISRMDKDDIIHWKNPETGERMGIPFEEYFKEPVKEITDKELAELNTLLGEDAFNETFDNIIYDYEHPTETKAEQPAERTTGGGEKEPGRSTESSEVQQGKEKTVAEPPLSEKDFYERFKAQHKDLRGVSSGEWEKNKISIINEGFKEGSNANALPISKGGAPTDIISKKYGNKEGDIIYLLPKEGVVDGPNGYKTKAGYKPDSTQIVRIEYDGQPTYEAYKNQFGKDVAKQKNIGPDDKKTPQQKLLDAIEEEKRMAPENEHQYLDKRKAVAEKYGKDIDNIIKELKEDKRLEVNCPPGTKRRISLKNLLSRKK